MELRDALRLLRSEIGFTQTELAEAVHVCFSAENRWENKNTRPNKAASLAIMDLARKSHVSSDCLEGLSSILLAPRADKGYKEELDRTTQELKSRQHDLLTSEQLKATIDNLDIAVIGHRAYNNLQGDTDIFYYNKPFALMFGYAPEEFEQLSSTDRYFALPTASREEYMRQLRLLLSDKITLSDFKPTLRACKKGGGEMWIEVKAASLTHYSYGCELFTTCRDITKRIETERRYHEEVTLRKITLNNFFANVYCDITANTVYRHLNLDKVIGENYAGETADELLELIMRPISEKSAVQSLNCEDMLDAYSKDNVRGSVRGFNVQARRWLQYDYVLITNPYNNHVEALIYIIDIQSKVLSERMIGVISEKYLEYIGLIDVSTEQLETYYYSDKCFKTSPAGRWNYPLICRQQLNDYGGEQNGADKYSEMSLEAVRAAISSKRFYTVVLSMRDYSGELRNKRISYTYLDENHLTIVMVQSDELNVTERLRDIKPMTSMTGHLSSSLSSNSASAFSVGSSR